MNSTPLKSLEGITSGSLFEQGKNIADSISSWRDGGTFTYNVPQTPKVNVWVSTNDKLNDDYWVARTNDFEELSAEARETLWKQLIKYSIASASDLDDCHTVHEEGYISELYDYKLFPYELADPPQGYRAFSYLTELFYQLQRPLKKRRFCNLVHILRSEDDRHAYVISLAIDPTLIPNSSPKPDMVDAQYSSVERVDYDGDKLRWVMTTCSDAKGNVPQWLARMSINSVVAKDVPHFMKWVHGK